MEINSVNTVKKQLDPSQKTVFISGVTGQDGSLMSDFLLKTTTYNIVGGARRLSVQNHENIRHLEGNKRFHLVAFDLTDAHAIAALVKELQPDYFINLAAQSFVKSSWDTPAQTVETDTIGVIHCLEAIRQNKPSCRFYNAGCHTPDTRVMTPSGLKYYHELPIGSLVYSINQRTKNLETKRILKVFEYDYEGDILEFKNGGLRVTPNHTMLYKTKRGKISSKKAECFVSLSDVKYPTSTPVDGKILPENINLEEFIPVPTKKGNRNYGKHITTINSHDLMYLIGLYIGDGSCRIMKKRHRRQCVFPERERNVFGRFTKNISEHTYEDVEYSCPQCILDIPPTDECFPEVIRVLERNDIRWKLYGQCDITFHQWGLNPYFSECGHRASQKRIPSWIFELHHSFQEKVLKGIMDSDGDNRNTISTSSKGLQEDLLKLFINCGIMPTFGNRPPREATLKDGRVIKGIHPAYHVHGLKENTGYQRGNYTRIPYKGKVWCFEIEDNHNFLVERNGKLTFSGNSSEEFGNVSYSPQDENHPLKPRSPYAAAKAAARHFVKVYRESYNLFAIQAWLFNHEGIRRGEEFVTRKITKGVVRLYREINGDMMFPIVPIELGNLDAKRDWSDAEDMVVAIWAMLNNDTPKEYVVSSGENHSIREFVELAFEGVGIKGKWIGTGANEEFVTDFYKDYNPTTLVRVNPAFYRPAEVEDLRGNSLAIRKEIGWIPNTDFKHLVAKMVHNDMNLAGLSTVFFNLHVGVADKKSEKS